MTAQPPRPVQISDLDPRLLDIAQRGRVALSLIAAEHDTPRGGRCPTCGWATNRYRPVCPSRAVARALREHTPLPAWLTHLTTHIPGAAHRAQAVSPARRRAAQDALAGLFDPPTRRPGTTK